MIIDSSHIQLVVRQQPKRAQVVPENGSKHRKPVDPPPMIEMRYESRNDSYNKEWLVSPRMFMSVELLQTSANKTEEHVKYLCGQLGSSLHKLKEPGETKDGGWFIFGDISVKKIGKYKLRFHLFDTAPSTGAGGKEENCSAAWLTSVDSDIFDVQNQRDFGSMSESTALTKAFSDQGVKLRVRKQDPHAGARTKRQYASPDPSPVRMAPGGPVQDYHYQSPHHPNKRVRSQSDFDSSSHYYTGMPTTESSMYHNGIVRTATNPTFSTTGMYNHSRGHSFSQQGSGHNYTHSTRGFVNTTPTWQTMQSALPSPASSTNVGTQQASPPYANPAQATSQSSFGDPGLNNMPMNRNSYYGANYQYSSNAQYQAQPSADTHHNYTNMQMPGTSLSDNASIVAPDPAYSANWNFPAETTEAGAGYAPYMHDGKY